MSHPFHQLIGEIVAGAELPHCAVIRDIACGGNGYVPIFSTPTWSDESKHAQVDMLVLREGDPGPQKVRAIIEVEESGFTPVKIFGKFATSAAASYFIPKPGGSPVEFDDRTVFVQVLDTSSLNQEKTAKLRQFDALETAICSFLPLAGSRVSHYRLFYGGEHEFRGQLGAEFIDFLRQAMSNTLPMEGWIRIEVLPVTGIQARGHPVPVARAGERWSETVLGKYAKQKGVYVIHHAGRIKYVGKTEKNDMSFGMRLRREFTEGGSTRRHIYPKLEALTVPPHIMVSFFPTDVVRNLVTPAGAEASDAELIEILEAGWIGAYKPEFQAGEN